MDRKIVHPKIESYLEGLLPEREAVFLEMEKLSRRKGFPAVGPLVGRLLEFLARAVGAKKILELGSGFGYSGLWFARALPADGSILLTDFEEENRQLARAHFKKAGLEHLMTFRVGDAAALLEDIEGPFDIVFNDIDKEFYPRVIDPVYEKLRPGGLFITDNTLWHGRVARKRADCTTRAVQEFNRRLQEHEGFMTVQVPLRDGLGLAIKL